VNEPAAETSQTHLPSGEPGVPGVIAPPPLIYLGGLGVGFALQAALPATSLAVWVSWPVGGVLLVAGAVLARSFFRAFHRASTPVSPYNSATALVTSGPYRLSRNPGYLGMALLYGGIAIAAQTLWAFVPLIVVLIAIDRGVIAREERYLEHRFGGEYRRYKRQTRRWL
jgi:protein-S-isoprenylcysteine O-methyltransferase Ste14